MFAVPFEQIAPIVGRSPAATRQLASRARRRVQGAYSPPGADRGRQREMVAAFLAASRNRHFGALLAPLDPEIVLRADDVAVQMGATEEVRGASAVADTIFGRARAAQPALINGEAGAVWAVNTQPRVVFGFTFTEAKTVATDMICDPTTLRELDLEFLAGSGARSGPDLVKCRHEGGERAT
jgi:hypothetical protein